MPLTPEQHEIARLLTDACRAAGPGAHVVYQSEWLGWLPYGQYQWVDVEHGDGKDDVSKRFPSGWEREDVLALEGAGILRRVREAHDPADSMTRIVYELMEEG